MNCKPGDLAVNVGGLPHCRGRIYVVLRPYDGHVFRRENAWWCDWRGQEVHVCDEHLRPIRDQDGEDETLSWAGKPEQVTA